MNSKNPLSARWGILAVGILTMLFAGIIYAWSILKVPLAGELAYESEVLALNFTLTMSFFCIGGLISSVFVRKIGTKFTLMLAGTMAGIGFILSSFLTADSAWMLYLTYAFLSGLGIGIAYITIISTVNAWFPD
ncbi:MAG: MFS transporter, partial [Clostridia bacterium]|nr:MFS transporter [Clostridia bacterium]